MKKKIVQLTFLLIIVILLSIPNTAFCLMTSTNYTIFADDFNSGIYATSTNFTLETTAGETPVGIVSSTSYEIRAGFQAMDQSSITFNLSDYSLDLGDLSTAAVSSDNTVVTITTDSDNGYVLSISGVSWTQGSLTNVSDDQVTAGSEEYGLSISGDDVVASLLSKDVSVSARSLMSSSSPVTGSQSTITFKASISGSTSAGARAQTVTMTVSNNL